MIKRILFLTVILFSLHVNQIFAADQDLNLPSTIINPDSFYYPLKRAWEKLKGNFAFSTEGRIEHESSLIKIRLAELKFIVENKILSEVQHSSERFAYSAGILTDEVVKQGDKKKKEDLIKEFKKYSVFLEKLRDNYPANTSFWMLIQHDINSLEILSERLK